jgi:hypothetical protein
MNTRRKTALILVLGLAAVTALQLSCKPIAYYLEQVYKVHGTVTLAGSAGATPVGSAEVFVGGYQYSELTNYYGDYEIELTEGTWTINFVKDGYEPVSAEVTVGPGAPRVELNVEMIKLIEIIFTAPAGQQIRGTTLFEGTYDGNVTSLELAIGTMSEPATLGSGAWSCSLNVAALPDGIYTAVATANPGAPNQASTTRIYEVDNDESMRTLRGTITLAAGLSGEIAPSTPLLVGATGGHRWNDIATAFPSDGFSYGFPFDYRLGIDAAEFNLFTAILDNDGEGTVTSGDFVGQLEMLVPDAFDDVSGVDIELDSLVADGRITVGVFNASSAAGKTVYYAVVDAATGDGMNPGTYLGVGIFDIPAGGAASFTASEFIFDPATFSLSLTDPVVPVQFDGGEYGVYLFVDAAENGFPPDGGDPGENGYLFLFGDTEVWYDYGGFEPF